MIKLKQFSKVLWVIFGGLELSLIWFITGILICLTIIGIPLGVHCFRLSKLVLWPFDKKFLYFDDANKFISNLIWMLFFGWELCIVSVLFGVLWSVTIIGLPFGRRFFKFAELALIPFGTEIVIREKDLF